METWISLNIFLVTHAAAFGGGVVAAILVPWVWKAGKWVIGKFS